MLWMEKGEVQFAKTFSTVDGIGSAHYKDHVYFLGGDPEKGKTAYFHRMKIKDYKFEKYEIDYGPILRCNHLMVGLNGTIFVLGGDSNAIGFSERIVNNDIWGFSISSKKWEKYGNIDNDIFQGRRFYGFTTVGDTIVISDGVSYTNKYCPGFIGYNPEKK